MPEFTASRHVRAPRDVAWSVISDLEGYADVAPNLSRAHVIEGHGEGARRRCYDNSGRDWEETCTLWDEGRRYTMEVDTRRYPYPFRRMRGTWSVDGAPGGSVVGMRFEYEMKYGAAGRLLDALFVRRTFARVCRELLDNWQSRIESKAAAPG